MIDADKRPFSVSTTLPIKFVPPKGGEVSFPLASTASTRMSAQVPMCLVIIKVPTNLFDNELYSTR